MSRFKAFSIHFAISFVIFLILLYFILVQWYPQPLFSTDGGWRVIRIIVGVDLIIGPFLTLIVFKSGKPGLKFDLAMIALVQALALSWGVWNTYNERPAAIIYTLDFFTPVPAYQLAEQGITAKELKQYGDTWPIIIYSDIPKENLSEVLAKSMREAKPLYLYNEYYKKFSKEQAEILKDSSMNLEKYVDDKPELKKLYQHSLLTSTAKTNISYLALHSREKWVTTVFDLDDMKIIDTIDIEPSAYTYAQKVKRKKKSATPEKSAK
ncbi:MAG: hypothetical protein OQK75_07565 [Gammaproteobacteria bacterium]|nr:hypothetical protein [Gammaproteobacteria bacterium]MCW8987514.1 hypothetical protein [Gammaproteobacteria bacterium]